MKKESEYIQEFKQKLMELKPIVLLEENEQVIENERILERRLKPEDEEDNQK